ncbi:MAG TPA: ACT domain-containing protein [Thermoanaerobaculia bacterium]|jgi:hypothetical protein
MQLRISILPQLLSVCRLAADAPLPDWPQGPFVSITRTPDELSVVCDSAAVPANVQSEHGWRALRVHGPIPFETTGVAAALVAPLAAARISVFLIATFDTDYLLVQRLEESVQALRGAGHDVQDDAC